MVGEVRVVGAGAEQVEDSDHVEGKHGGRHVATAQQGRETAVEEDTGAVGGGRRLGEGQEATIFKNCKECNHFPEQLILNT